MITFISSKVSNRHFTLTSNPKNLSKTRYANFSFSVYYLIMYIYIFFLFFCFFSKTNKARCSQRLGRNKFKKNCKPIQTSVAPFSGSLVHSKDPDQTPQSVESDHGLH